MDIDFWFSDRNFIDNEYCMTKDDWQHSLETTTTTSKESITHDGESKTTYDNNVTSPKAAVVKLSTTYDNNVTSPKAAVINLSTTETTGPSHLSSFVIESAATTTATVTRLPDTTTAMSSTYIFFYYNSINLHYIDSL